MIRKLTEKNRETTLAFLQHEAAINLFIIGDIERYGFDKPFQELWGDFDENGNLNGVLLRYHESFIPYYKRLDFDSASFKEIIRSYKGQKIISGKKSIIDLFMDTFETANEKVTYFCELTKDHFKPKPFNPEEVRQAKISDAKRIYDFMETITEFTSIGNSVERIEEKLKNETGRIYYMENEVGEIMSIAQTAAENSKTAMIVGVATYKAYRGQGLVGQCLSKLCSDVLKEKEGLCLFYHNPSAGKVYHALGFKTIEQWTMLVEKV